MKSHRLPMWRTLAAAYRELPRLMTAMPSLMLSAFLILVATSAAAEFVPKQLSDQHLSGSALGLVQNAIEALLLTPVFIAIHRFIVVDGVTRAYVLPSEGNFWLFAGWLFALKVLTGLPIDFLGVLQLLNASLAASSLAFAVALIAAIAWRCG